jgi:hypothetical protein
MIQSVETDDGVEGLVGKLDLHEVPVKESSTRSLHPGVRQLHRR